MPNSPARAPHAPPPSSLPTSYDRLCASSNSLGKHARRSACPVMAAARCARGCSRQEKQRAQHQGSFTAARPTSHLLGSRQIWEAFEVNQIEDVGRVFYISETIEIDKNPPKNKPPTWTIWFTWECRSRRGSRSSYWRDWREAEGSAGGLTSEEPGHLYAPWPTLGPADCQHHRLLGIRVRGGVNSRVLSDHDGRPLVQQPAAAAEGIRRSAEGWRGAAAENGRGRGVAECCDVMLCPANPVGPSHFWGHHLFRLVFSPPNEDCSWQLRRAARGGALGQATRHPCRPGYFLGNNDLPTRPLLDKVWFVTKN